MLKLAMIGSRGHFGYVISCLPGLSGKVEVIGISSGCEDPIDRLRDSLREIGISPAVYDDYHELLGLKPDMVVIDGPFEKHAVMAIEALKQGIHVFCEKPIALNLSDLDELTKVYRAGKAKMISMVGLRYDGAFACAKKLVDAGAIGKIKLVKTQKSYKLGVRPEFYKHRASYGGTIPWVGSHALDWIIYFTGSCPEKIWANQTREDNFGNGELEIAAQCQMVLKNGVMASASIDYLRPASAPTHGDDRIRLAGTQGVLEVSGGKVKLIDAEGERFVDVPECERELFSDFVFDVLGERKAWVDGEDTLNLTRACLLAQESADSGELVLWH